MGDIGESLSFVVELILELEYLRGVEGMAAKRVLLSTSIQ